MSTPPDPVVPAQPSRRDTSRREAPARSRRAAARPPADPRAAELARLAERVEFLEDVIRNLPVGVVVIDADMRIALTNPLGDEIREVGDRIGQPLNSCHPARMHEAVEAVFRRLREDPPDRDHPLVVERRSRWEVHYSRISGRDGGFRGVNWVAVDITRQKELQRQLLHQERLASIGRMATRLAHDVKNSLNVITGALHVLRRSPPGDPRAEEMTGIIEAQVSRLGLLVDHLRDVSRPMEVRREPCDVRAVVEAAVRDVRLQHDCLVRVEAPEDLPVLSLDATLVGRLLANALDNAARAGGPGTTLHVRLALDTRQDGERLVIDILDDGPGFAEEVLSHLFEPFVTTRPDGTGLGLIIMREVCRLHGGDLEIANRDGGGGRVTARLRC